MDLYRGKAPMNKVTGLGFLKGSHCPHYDGEPGRRPSYHRLISLGELGPGITADDGVALHYINSELFQVVSSRPYARAYHVKMRDGIIVENEIIPKFLG